MSEREQLIDYLLADLDPDGYGWAAGDGPTVEEIAKSLETSGWLAAHDEAVRAEERERIATAIEAVDPVEWALSGERAGADAAKIARAGGAS